MLVMQSGLPNGFKKQMDMLEKILGILVLTIHHHVLKNDLSLNNDLVNRVS